MSITKNDLYKRQFDYETLKTNIYFVSLLDILKTQKLTKDFCIKYILNSDFQLLPEEQTIDIEIVKKYQPHISISLFDVRTNKRQNSFPNFDSYISQ
jgi:hypothetical protein